MKLFTAMLAMGVLSSGAAVGTAFACDGEKDVPETTVVVATEAAGDCGGCDSATEVVVAEGDCGGCEGAAEVVVEKEGDCGGCDSATEVVVAEGGCGDCETVCGTCEVMTALEGVELSDHGKAVLALGQAGVPVWIDEAGFGMVDGQKVDCPVSFSRAATQFIAAMGAEAGCEVCQEVVATAESDEPTEATAAKQAEDAE